MKQNRKHVIYLTPQYLRIAVIELKAEGAVMVHHDEIDLRNTTQEDIIERLKDFLRQTKTVRESWILVVAQSQVLWKTIMVPSHDLQEIDKMVRLSMKTSVWDSDEFIFDYRIIEKNPQGYARILAGIIHQEALAQHRDMLNSAGIRCAGWSVDSMAVKCLSDGSGISLADDACILVHADLEKIDLYAFVGKEPLFVKTFPPDAYEDQEFFLRQVSLFAASCVEQHKDKAFRLNVIAADRRYQDLENILKKNLTIPVDRSAVSADEQDNSSWLPLLGTARSDNPFLMNWVPSQVRQKSIEQLRVRRWAECAVLFAVICVFAGSIAAARYFQKAEHLSQLRKNMDIVRKKMDQAEGLAKHLDEARAQADQRIFLSDVLVKLEQMREPSVYLNRLEWIKRDGLVLQGAALSEAQVNNFQKQLIVSRLFEDVSLQYAQRKQGRESVYFKIRCAWKKG